MGLLKSIKKKITKKYLAKYYNCSLADLRNNNDNYVSDIKFIKDFIIKKYNQENYIYTVMIDGMIFYFSDSIVSNTVNSVAEEINNKKDYNFDNIKFSKDGVAIDIGGNVGMVSIYLAKKYPFLKIYAFEPVKENYDNFLINLKLNNIPDGQVIVHNKAVTKDSRAVVMNINFNNKGGSAISDVLATNYNFTQDNYRVQSVTLEEIFTMYKIKKLDLLKIDCEGSEYEILYNAPEKLLKNINHIRGEFHENKKLTKEYDIDALVQYLHKYVDDIDVVEGRDCFIIE